MVKDKRKLTYPLSTKRDYEEFVSYGQSKTANILFSVFRSKVISQCNLQ